MRKNEGFTGTPKEAIAYLLNLDENKEYTIIESKKKRNKDQNAKYWKLLGQLAIKLKTSIEELHFQMLQYYSQRYQISVPSDYELRGIEYFQKKSTFQKNGKEYTVYWVFVPSHELSEREFSLLLSGLVEDCQQNGIETLSPDELEKLKSNWG